MGRRITAVFFEKGKKEGKKRRARKIWAGSRPPFSSSIVFLFFPLSFQSPLESLSLSVLSFWSFSIPFSLFLFSSSSPRFFPFSSSFPGVPYREKQHVLAIDTGPVVSYIYITSLSFFLSFESTLARFYDLLFFLSFFLSFFRLFLLLLFVRSRELWIFSRLPYPLMLAIERGIFSFFFSFYARSKSSKLGVLWLTLDVRLFERIWSCVIYFAERLHAEDWFEAIGGEKGNEKLEKFYYTKFLEQQHPQLFSMLIILLILGGDDSSTWLIYCPISTRGK